MFFFLFIYTDGGAVDTTDLLSKKDKPNFEDAVEVFEPKILVVSIY